MKIWIPVIRAGTGADTYFSELARGLRLKGLDVTLSWLPRFAEIFPMLLSGVRAPEGTDIIHSNSWHGFPFAGRGAKLFVSVLHWVHSADYAAHRGYAREQYHRRLIHRYEERSLRAAQRVIAISEYTRAQVVADLPGADPIVAAPGVDTDRFVPASSGVPPDGRFRLLYLGSASRRKGFGYLPAIMEKLGPQFVLHYNRGPRMPPAANMEFIGELGAEELVRACQRCDAFIFPTTYEGFGYVAAEAMACGRPVIASDCSALPELVAHGDTGLLCPVGDVDAFAAAARQLQADHGLRRRMGEAARRRMLENFSLHAMVERHLRIYTDTV